MTARYDFPEDFFTEGDDTRFYFIFTDPSTGTYYDWTGVTKAWITVKKNHWDTDAQAKLQLDTDTNPTQLKIDYPTADFGQMWVWAKAAECKTWAAEGSLLYDVKVIKDGLENRLVKGIIPFSHEITQATS